MKKAPITLLSALAIASGSQAAILANYDFQVVGGSTANTVSTASTVSSSSYTASALSGGDGLKGSIPTAGAITAPSTTGATNTQHLVVRVSGTDAADENDKAGAIAANDYYGVYGDPECGNQPDLHLANLRSRSQRFIHRHGVHPFESR